MMIKACQMNMLNTDKTSNSRQCARGMRNGTFMANSAKPNTGVPSHRHSVRNVRGGKPVTPIFMMGQLMPQTKVSKTKMVHCVEESLCICSILGGRVPTSCHKSSYQPSRYRLPLKILP